MARNPVTPRLSTVLLVDDQTATREAISRLIDEETGLAVIGQAATIGEATRLDITPDVIVTEIELPECRDAELIGALRARWPDARILAFTGVADDGRATNVIRATATGYVLKTVTSAELIEAVRGVAAGIQQLMPGWLAMHILQAGERPDTTLDDDAIDVLRDWAAGFTAGESGDRLDKSKRAVEAKRKQIKDRLGLEHRHEIVEYARRIGLFSISAVLAAETAVHHVARLL